MKDKLFSFRYDEWVKADRIIWPLDKGGPKKKQKKKVKVGSYIHITYDRYSNYSSCVFSLRYCFRVVLHS